MLSLTFTYTHSATDPRADRFSKPDPFVVVFSKPADQDRWAQVGKTEPLKNTIRAVWKKPIEVKFLGLAARQELKLVVRDDDGWDTSQLLFETRVPIAQLFQGSTEGKLQVGSLWINWELIDQDGSELRFEMSAKGLRKMDWVTCGDFYGEIRKPTEQGAETILLQTGITKGTKSPNWGLQSLKNVKKILQLPLKLEILDQEAGGKKKPQSVEAPVSFLLEDLLERKELTLKISSSASVFLRRPVLVERKTFLMLLPTIQIQVTIAIDFTASNGPKTDVGSLHFQGTNLNDYEEALETIGGAITPYDVDGTLDLLGFGGIFVGDSKVNHLKELGETKQPLVEYRKTLKTVTLSGPTFMQPIIQRAILRKVTSMQYKVLVILTDGAASDVAKVQTLLAQHQGPLSIIIVGVGEADFSAMKALDKCPQTQFVSIHELRWLGRTERAAKILEELPGDIERYFNR